MKPTGNVAFLVAENVKEIMPYTTAGVNSVEISMCTQLGKMKPTSGKYYDLFCIIPIKYRDLS